MAAQNKIGQFDNHTDIGNCKNKGFAYYDPENQTYTIGGSGTNMWFGSDEFHYLWTTIQGDFILQAEVEFMGKGVEAHRKCGWIVKNSLNANSMHVNASVHGDGLTCLQYRKSIGSETEQIISRDSFPDIIQLERKGNSFILSTAVFGQEFTHVMLDSLTLDNEVYVGIYVCSHNPEIVETAVFRNVRITKPAKPDFKPYRDYIGSNLEILDIESGNRKIIYSSSHSIQAPNWTVDGKRLIFNSKGLLYDYNLENNTINPINTGFATSNNNDHVLSFDGRYMGISHHNVKDNGNSGIYYFMLDQNTEPKAVTKTGVGASYLHGWSPDNKKMIFTGERNGKFNIYSVDVASGKETQITNLGKLDDGSEYSPDGKYIFLNSVKSGKMKLWRVDSDGKNAIQLTFDEYNDWFPHVSPDMKWIVFISFPKDIDPMDHPFYKPCILRIMPYSGGKPTVIAYLYGGQGTINVPSWSPDSKKIAFVSNSDRL